MIQLLYWNKTRPVVQAALACFGIGPIPEYGYNELWF
jgi:hypothetical protein